MYKGTSESMQRRVSRIHANQLPSFDITEDGDEAEREAAKARLKQIEKEILAAPKKSKERKELGLIKLELQNRINFLRPKFKGPKTLDRYLIDVFKEFAPKHFWKICMDEALRRHDAERDIL